MKVLVYAIAILLITVGGYGQEASMHLDRTEIRIGEQVTLKLSLEYQNPKGDALLIWPQYDQFITDGIEVIQKTVDRDRLVDSSSATYVREQRLAITAFEPNAYTIPTQSIYLNDSVFTTQPLQLTVHTVEVDTSKGITDIKPIYSVNYPFSERSKDWLKENWLVITMILAAVLAFFVWRYLKNRKPDIQEEEPEVIIPAHIIALETLNKLLREEQWKSPEKKAYYSELTDTVRSYLENRFEIHAMEKTTREIIQDLKFAAISEEDKVYLRKILREADMVKFAKFKPNDEDAHQYLNNSIDFVNKTKKEPNPNGEH